jgi:coatomer protein complex subunit gamma
LDDEADEARERAALLCSTLEEYPVPAGALDPEAAPEFHAKDKELKFLLGEKMPMDFAALERSAKAFMQHPNYDKPITFSSLPIIEEAYVPPVIQPGQRSAAAGKKKTTADIAAAVLTGEVAVDPAAAVYAVPELAYLGRAFRSCAEVALTETEMEYVVKCVKHIFENHIVLQFSVLNTVDDQSLRNVYVNVALSDEESYSVEKTIPAAVARYGEKSNNFVVLKMSDESAYAAVTCGCQLMFKMVQVNPATGEVEGDEDGYDEEYPLEDLDILTRDFMAKFQVGDFRRVWEQLGTDGEVLEKFALQFKKLEEAVVAVADFLGMQPADGTNVIPTATDGSRRSHTLHLVGMFLGNISVLVRAQLQLDESGGILLKLAVRSESMDISQTVAGCIQ